MNVINDFGKNCIIDNTASIGENVIIGHNCIIEENVYIGSNTYIDSNTIIRQGTYIGENSFIGSNCIVGEYLVDFFTNRTYEKYSLMIGRDALIRSGSIIYTESFIGNSFQTGHQVTIREKAKIGNHVSVGTMSDIQGNCTIGNYVRMHSNVFIASLSVIDDFVWIFSKVVLTNDPTPPSNNFVGIHIHPFAVIAAGAIIMPGIEVGQDALVAAGCILTKNAEPYTTMIGNPGKFKGDVRTLKSKITGEAIYPWRYHFDRYMPWEGGNFKNWYSGLSLQEKEKYKLVDLIEDEFE